MYVPMNAMPADARIWIFQSPRPLTEGQEELISKETERFLEDWTAHEQALKASYALLERHFLILAIDERQAMASGCSIDKSIHLIRSLNQQLGLDLLDRMSFAYRGAKGLEVVPRQEFERLVREGVIREDTRVFNNLVERLGELDQSWEVPFARSWHRQLVG